MRTLCAALFLFSRRIEFSLSIYYHCAFGGIISPILSNIYLNELDKFVMGIAKDFDKPSNQYLTEEYAKAIVNVRNIKRKINKESNSEKRPQLLEDWKEARKILLQTPAKSQTDKKLNAVMRRNSGKKLRNHRISWN
jgi:hypothetical protein